MIQSIKTSFDKPNGSGYKVLCHLLQDNLDQLVLIDCIEEYVLLDSTESNNNSLLKIFRFILQVFYDSELLNETTLLNWIAKRRSLTSGKKYDLFHQTEVQQFVDWIEEDSEDEDDDDDDDDEEDDDKN